MRINWASISEGSKSSRDCVVDFYCHKAGLVIEVDGDIHDLQQEEDARREKVLREMGLRTCTATERSVEALSAVVGKIREVVLGSE